MKAFVWVCLLGLSLNSAWALRVQDDELLPDTEASSTLSEHQSSKPKFSALVKSTMELMSPEVEVEVEEFTQVSDAQTLTQTPN